MRSIVTGEEIPDDELWVWTPHKGLSSKRVYEEPISSRAPDGCSKCGAEYAELFEVDSPTSGGVWYLCHRHLLELQSFFSKPSKQDCPVCGMKSTGSGHGRVRCSFGHEWRIQTERSSVPVYQCCLCDEWKDGLGNNPRPFKGDKCCDECHNTKVLPERIKLAGGEKEEEAV